MFSTNTSFRGKSFTTELFIVSLGGCDLVLGFQWLRNLGLILWEFLELTMEFCYGAKTIMLKGLYITRLVVIEVENFPRLARAEKKGLEIPLIEESEVPDFNVVEGCISNPLGEFKAVFEELKAYLLMGVMIIK